MPDLFLPQTNLNKAMTSVTHGYEDSDKGKKHQGDGRVA